MRDPFPVGIWSRSATAVVLLAVGAPPLLYWLVEPAERSAGQMVTVAQFGVVLIATTTATATYFHFRLARQRALGWAALVLTVYALECLTLAMIRVTDHHTYDRPGWVLALALAAAAASALVACFGVTRDCPGDPLALGLAIGISVALLHLYLDATGPVIGDAVPVVVLGLATVALWTFVALRLTRATTALPGWMTSRLAVGIVLLATSRVLAFQPLPPLVLAVLVALASLVGGVLILTAAIAGLRWAVHEDEERREQLADRLAQLEALRSDQRSRLHEITNTVAGIACASHLIHEESDLPEHDRNRLEEMLDRESARLVRILDRGVPDPAVDVTEATDASETTGTTGTTGAADGPSTTDGAPEAPATSVLVSLPTGPAAQPRQVIDLDDLLRPLVSAQMAIGREVVWTPRGLRAWGEPDAVSEAINILLDNSRKHAPRSSTVVVTRAAGGGVEILVVDDGPGMAVEVRDRWSAPGVRRSDSPGQGLGLGLARTRLATAGGSLDLLPSRTGTAFAVNLRAAPAPDRSRHGPADAAATATRDVLKAVQ